MKNLIQFPAEFDYNLLLHALRDYKKPRDKIRGLLKNKDIVRVRDFMCWARSIISPKKVFNIGVRIEDAGDQKKFLAASPEKALCDMTAMQTHITTKREMKEFLKLMRLDYSVNKGASFKTFQFILIDI